MDYKHRPALSESHRKTFYARVTIKLFPFIRMLKSLELFLLYGCGKHDFGLATGLAIRRMIGKDGKHADYPSRRDGWYLNTGAPHRANTNRRARE